MPEQGLAIALHGGAGSSPRRERRLLQEEGCREAALAGWEVLRAGREAREAVLAAVRVLEYNPFFNAGRGSYPAADGNIYMDASIMEGHTLRWGAVAGLERTMYPSKVAALLMREPQCFLMGEHARRFATEKGIPECELADLLVTDLEETEEQEDHGTVGCVARDSKGNLAAGTSTGGLADKNPGREGDSCIIAAGTYADAIGAASATGRGERIVSVALAFRAVQLLDRRAPQEAADLAVGYLYQMTRARGGLILLNTLGEIGIAHNTPHMSWATIVGDGEIRSYLQR